MKKEITDILNALIESEIKREDELKRGLNRKDGGRNMRIASMVNHITDILAHKIFPTIENTNSEQVKEEQKTKYYYIITLQYNINGINNVRSEHALYYADPTKDAGENFKHVLSHVTKILGVSSDKVAILFYQLTKL